MPLPMVHLEIGYALRALVSREEFGFLLMGSIAPDAIHKRPGSTAEDKRRVHLFESDDTLDARFARIDELKASATGAAQRSFLDGWLIHLATDCLWSQYFVHGVWDRHSAGLSATEKRESYYREADKVDFLLYHTATWRREAFEILRGIEAPAFLSLLSAAEIGAWRDRLLLWFTQLKEEPTEAPKCFTMERVTRFAAMAAVVCRTGIEQGFRWAGVLAQKRYPADFPESEQ